MFDITSELKVIRSLADKWVDGVSTYPPMYMRGYLLGKCSVLRRIASDTQLPQVIATEDYIEAVMGKVSA